MLLRSEIETDAELNLTPMIDVVFNLLIFFLLGATFLTNERDERELELRLPTVREAEPLTEAPEEITVAILADGRIDLQGEMVSLAELVRRLVSARANYADQAVAVRGDADVRYERVAKVVSACKEAGIGHVDLVAVGESTP